MIRTPGDLSPAANESLQDSTVRRIDPEGLSAPVVFDSPHSGTVYPPDFRPAVPLSLLQGGEDRFVDELVADAPQQGAVLILALFARTYIDPNRTLVDLDAGLLDRAWPGKLQPSDHTMRGVGLIFRHIGERVPIYDRLLTVSEVQRRIDLCWRPYHQVLNAAVDEAYQHWGTEHRARPAARILLSRRGAVELSDRHGAGERGHLGQYDGDLYIVQHRRHAFAVRFLGLDEPRDQGGDRTDRNRARTGGHGAAHHADRPGHT